jgi:hypothetical protein
MALIRDQIASTARESVKRSTYKSDSAQEAGFDAFPNAPETADRSSDVRSAEQYEKGNLPGVNVYVCKQRK